MGAEHCDPVCFEVMPVEILVEMIVGLFGSQEESRFVALKLGTDLEAMVVCLVSFDFDLR